MTTIIKIRWLNLTRDYLAMALTFVLPIIFFSVFALLFSGPPAGTGTKLTVLLIDQDESSFSRRMAAALKKQESLLVTDSPQSMTREDAQQAVRQGDYVAAIVIGHGWGQALEDSSASPVALEVIHDSSNPTAAPTIGGLLQASAMQAAPDLLMTRSFKVLEGLPGGELSPQQRKTLDDAIPFLRGERPWSEWPGDPPSFAAESDEPADNQSAGLIAVQNTPARAQVASAASWNRQSSVSYYAAGLGVMFLLFSMTSAGGVFLDEEESGTLERMMMSNAGVGDLLYGNWLFFAVLGIVQVTLMFFWGGLVFGMNLWTPNRFTGFIAMTIVTGAAASALGMLLATLCKSRIQLNGISTILILIMSAVGGSMIPRFLMPKFMLTASLLTFNGWALDGYLKILWYDDPNATLLQSLARLVPQLAVLAGMTLVFLAIARVMARRWEVV